MLKDLFWFLLGGWIGSLVTLVMVALFRANREAPKPAMRDTDEDMLSPPGEKRTVGRIIRSNNG